MQNKLRVAFLFLLLSVTLFTNAQTVDEILTNHVEAIGGKTKLLSTKSIKTVFKSDSEFAGSGAVFIVQGEGYKIESKSALGHMTNIINKKKGWKVYRFAEGDAPTVEELTESDRVLAFPSTLPDVWGAMPTGVALCYLYFTKSNEYSATLLGKEMVDGKECFAVEMKKLANKQTLYIDSKTWYCIKRKTKGEEFDEIIMYEDFRKNEDGCILPYVAKSIDSKGKQFMTVTFSLYETGVRPEKEDFTYSAK
jgi:hypothetical protein